MPAERILIAANRLPVSAQVHGDAIELTASSGGLATGLRPWHERRGALWFGWPGDLAGTSDTQRATLDQRLYAGGMVPVHLSSEQVTGYYHGFANRVLWPLFHYSIDRVPVDAAGWAAYEEVNTAFAQAIVSEYRPGDLIWVHDYHLLLLPALLRERLPHARIGFFLHVPFPSSEVFRVLPWRRAILNGLLGADLIGFHTYSYLRHFMMSLLHVEGVEPDVDCVCVGGHHAKVGAFPMGVDAAIFQTLARDPDIIARADTIRREAGGRRILLGVDRLDYTKGIPQRFEALAHLFEREPALRDGVRYVQVAVPSRGDVDAYQRFRREIEEAVGRVNGTFGTLQSLPIHYVRQSVTASELVALYCAADVMIVTPLRDGMNLVAKEFAASRVDEDGVLVLSEFAGAAAELHGALIVNPYDTELLAESVRRGLSMPVEERRARMRSLRRRVLAYDVHAWADHFVTELAAQRPFDAQIRPPERPLLPLLASLRESKRIRLLVDYDGTLVPLARSPELAVPDEELLALLARLASSPAIDIDVVSGRTRESLERWLGHLPIALWAEHGFWHRPSPKGRWETAVPFEPDWMTRVRSILEEFAARTPGAHVEVKAASLAWHYRESPRDFASRQAHELRLLLGDLLSNQPFEVLDGKKVLEVRLRGVNKGMVAQQIRANADAGVAVVAIGDDRTDDDLFKALPPDAVSIAVGRLSSVARYRVDNYQSVRRLLRLLIDDCADTQPVTSQRGRLGQAISA